MLCYYGMENDAAVRDMVETVTAMLVFVEEAKAKDVAPSRAQLTALMQELDGAQSLGMHMWATRVLAGTTPITICPEFEDQLDQIDPVIMAARHKISDAASKRRAWMSITTGEARRKQ